MKIIFLIFSILCINLCAQTPINNKGNRNQAYPAVTEIKPEIANLIDLVSQNELEASIRFMQQYYRISTSPEALLVQNWLTDKFESYGYDWDIHYFSYFSQQLEAGNVVVVKEGTEFPDEYILITSHYDHSSWGSVSGPGADDNASGTAGVLECARLLQNFPTKRSIMFVPFNAEEDWMAGSLPFAKHCADKNMNIIAHFNMDMIGWFPPNNPNTIMASGYSFISKALFDFYFQTANKYIPSVPTILLSDGDSYGGDHMPFNMFEYPSLYVGDIEYMDYHPCYHKMCDTIGPYQAGVNCGVNRLDLAQAFVQSVLCATAELANAWLPPQNLSACSDIDKITISWDKDGEFTSYKVYRNNTILGETNDTFFVDNDVEIGGKYEYYVIAHSTGKESAPSNKDAITFVAPLQMKYSNNFNEDKHGFEQSDWVIRNIQGKGSLCNTSGNGTFSDNYLSMAELDWFPVPSGTDNISIRFKWRGNLRGITSNIPIWSDPNIGNTGLYFEVTTDRKTWQKLAYFTGILSNWKEYEFSLAPYLGSPFFQARFRLESSGADGNYTKIAYITDVEVGYGLGIEETKSNFPYISSFHFFPNPANTHINIITDQQKPYQIAIYDMSGKIIFAQEGFTDGALSVSNLNSGNYLIVASTQQHRVAKKLVVQ